jgi:nicotinamidase-related amidase
MSTALLVIDIQNDYFPGGVKPLFEADRAAQNAARAVAHFRKVGRPVIFVRHLSRRPGSSFFIPSTLGAEIAQAVRPAEDEAVIEKAFPNSFRDTTLDALLKALGVGELVVCGMMSHMCVDATVRAAKDLGYNVTLLADACTSCDLESFGSVVGAAQVHAAFMAALAYYYARVVRVDDYLSDGAAR